MYINKSDNFFYLEDDLISNSLIKYKKYYSNLQISKNIYNRYYFRVFKEFFKLDSFNKFQYRLIYFKFFYFWNFFFLLHWARYKYVIKKFFLNFFYNKNFMLFFFNTKMINGENIIYIEDFSSEKEVKDIYFFIYVNSTMLFEYGNILNI